MCQPPALSFGKKACLSDSLAILSSPWLLSALAFRHHWLCFARHPYIASRFTLFISIFTSTCSLLGSVGTMVPSKNRRKHANDGDSDEEYIPPNERRLISAAARRRTGNRRSWTPNQTSSAAQKGRGNPTQTPDAPKAAAAKKVPETPGPVSAHKTTPAHATTFTSPAQSASSKSLPGTPASRLRLVLSGNSPFLRKVLFLDQRSHLGKGGSTNKTSDIEHPLDNETGSKVPSVQAPVQPTPLAEAPQNSEMQLPRGSDVVRFIRCFIHYGRYVANSLFYHRSLITSPRKATVAPKLCSVWNLPIKKSMGVPFHPSGRMPGPSSDRVLVHNPFSKPACLMHLLT